MGYLEKMNSGFQDARGKDILNGHFLTNECLVVIDRGNFWAINYKNQNNRKPLEEFIRYNSTNVKTLHNSLKAISIMQDMVKLNLNGLEGKENVFGDTEILLLDEDYNEILEQNKLRISNDLDRHLDHVIQYLIDDQGMIVGQVWDTLADRENHYNRLFQEAR